MTIDEKIKQAAEENYKSIPWQYVNNQSFQSVHNNAFAAGYKDGMADPEVIYRALHEIMMANLKSEMLADMQKLVEALELIAFKSEFIASYQDELNLTRKQAKEALSEWKQKYQGEK